MQSSSLNIVLGGFITRRLPHRNYMGLGVMRILLKCTIYLEMVLDKSDVSWHPECKFVARQFAISQ